jgi:hypothetical protein
MMGTDMATNNGNNSNIDSARETYDRFMSMTKWGVIAVVVVLLLMALLLV